MKKLFSLGLTVIPLILLTSLSASAKLGVVTTIPDLAAIAQEIGGDKVDVKSIARGDEDPHYLEPKPSYVVMANRADLLIEVGLQLESGWLPVLITQSRNPKIQSGNPGRLDASEGVKLLDVPTGGIDRSQGDVHPDGNPHYWLDPRNGLVIARSITTHLTALDSKNSDYYLSRLNQFKETLTEKIRGWEQAAAPLKGKRVVAYHKNFSYLTTWLGLSPLGYIEPKPGIPPSPAHTLELINIMNSQKTPFILTAGFYDMKAAQEISRMTDAKLLILPSSVGGAPGVKTYTDLFDAIIRQLTQ